MDNEDITRLSKLEEEFLDKASDMFSEERENALIREKVARKFEETDFGRPMKSAEKGFIKFGLVLTGILLVSLILYFIYYNPGNESKIPQVKKAISEQPVGDSLKAKLVSDSLSSDSLKQITEKPKIKKKKRRKVLEPVSGLPVDK
jgi:hypothetical protein